MADITAAMVRELRDKTDAPMMECKKALTEANGNLDKAEELLRIRLGNKASRASARLASEGVIGMHVAADGKSGAIVEVNCETDFVAKNQDFLAFAGKLAELAVRHNPVDLAALAALSLDGSSVEEVRRALVGRMGENMAIRRFSRIAATGSIARYVHGGSKIGVLLDFVGADDMLAKDIAMHIAAVKPLALSKDDIPAELLKKERDIAAAKAAETGKPAAIIEKMIDGSVQKFLKEVTLLSQPFVKDDKQSVEQVLKSKGASVLRFTLYVVGEGIEKKSSDFAAEVMAQADLAKKVAEKTN